MRMFVVELPSIQTPQGRPKMDLKSAVQKDLSNKEMPVCPICQRLLFECDGTLICSFCREISDLYLDELRRDIDDEGTLDADLLDELKKMCQQVHLPKDFKVVGLGRANENISEIQSLRDRAHEIMMQFSDNLEIKAHAYDLAREHVLEMNSLVATKKSEDLRNAFVNILIRDIEDAMFRARRAMNRVKDCMKHLSIINHNVSRQLSAIKLEMEGEGNVFGKDVESEQDPDGENNKEED